MAKWCGFEMGRQHAVARSAHRRHHAVRADGDDAVGSVRGRSPARPSVLPHRPASPARCCPRRRGPAAASARTRAPRRSTTRPRRQQPRSPRPCSGRSASCSRRSTSTLEPAARSAAPIENSTALPRPPPTRITVSPAGISVGEPVGPISTTGSPGCSSAHKSDEPPISSTMVETRPCSRSTQAPVIASPSIARRVAVDGERVPLVVLQPIELAGPETARGRRRAHHHLDDRRREPDDLVHARTQLPVQAALRTRPRSVSKPARPCPAHG